MGVGTDMVEVAVDLWLPPDSLAGWASERATVAIVVAEVGAL